MVNLVDYLAIVHYVDYPNQRRCEVLDIENITDIREHREQHVGRLLLRAQRAVNARAAVMLQNRDHRSLTLAHLAVVPHIDDEGTRPKAIADRAGMTKQGISPLLADLERLGYLERGPDPSDGRATLVRFTQAGHSLLTDGVEVTRAIETDYARLLGESPLQLLKRQLSTIIAFEAGRH